MKQVVEPQDFVTTAWRESLRWGREVKLSLAILSELRTQYTNIKSYK